MDEGVISDRGNLVNTSRVNFIQFIEFNNSRKKNIAYLKEFIGSLWKFTISLNTVWEYFLILYLCAHESNAGNT